MSGKDERKLFDVPVCSGCERRPKYWILINDAARHFCVGWLLSNLYIGENQRMSKHIIIKNSVDILDFQHFLEELTSIRCGDNSYHTFRKGGVMFNKLKMAIKQCYSKEKYQKG